MVGDIKPLNKSVYVILLMIAIACGGGGFCAGRYKYEPDSEHKSWLRVYDEVDKTPRNGYLWEGIVYPNKDGAISIYGYGVDTSLIDIRGIPYEYCNEITRRWKIANDKTR